MTQAKRINCTESLDYIEAECRTLRNLGATDELRERLEAILETLPGSCCDTEAAVAATMIGQQAYIYGTAFTDAALLPAAQRADWRRGWLAAAETAACTARDMRQVVERAPQLSDLLANAARMFRQKALKTKGYIENSHLNNQADDAGEFSKLISRLCNGGRDAD